MKHILPVSHERNTGEGHFPDSLSRGTEGQKVASCIMAVVSHFSPSEYWLKVTAYWPGGYADTPDVGQGHGSAE